jgi:hypothetical protein
VVTGVAAAVFSHALDLGYKWRMAERQKEVSQAWQVGTPEGQTLWGFGSEVVAIVASCQSAAV